MKLRVYLLRLLNVRGNEWPLVKQLFLFEFLQGAGMAFFFTATSALFLEKYGVEELPKVFIYSSFLLWIAGYVYSKLEAKLRIITLARGITFFLAASCLVFWLGVNYLPSGVLYLMMAWFNVLYLLNNLEFWGIASLLFDVRQSKRLFGIISAGDIPAKFIGYSLALVVVSYIGTANLLLAGFFCMLASLPLLKKIRKTERIAKHEAHHHQHHGTHLPARHAAPAAPSIRHAAHSVKQIIKNFSVNALIRRIAVVTVITSFVFNVANFSFYAKVKEAFHTDLNLAQFIALFFAIVRFGAMILKMVFTSRLINRLGTINSLLITPVLMILLVSAVLVLEQYSPGQRAVLYLFGALVIVVDVLRTAINTPVFLTLMQPLGTHERLRAHTIVKGIMDPFAFLTTGLLLLGVLKLEHAVHIETLSYLLLFFGLLWIVGIYLINRQYLQTLLKTIGNHFFHNSEFSLADSFTMNWIRQKLASGDEEEAENILKMVAMNNQLPLEELVEAALEHPSEKIRAEALRLANQRQLLLRDDVFVFNLLQEAQSPVLKAEAVQMLSRQGVRGEAIVPLIQSGEEVVQHAALTGILKKEDAPGKATAEGYLQYMLVSEDPAVRGRAARVLQELDGVRYLGEIRFLMEDGDAAVRREAFLAASRCSDPVLLQALLAKLETDEKSVLEALQAAGAAVLPYVEESIRLHPARVAKNKKLIRLSGRIGGERAQQLLLRLLRDDSALQQLLVKTLYHTHYRAAGESHSFFEGFIRENLRNAATILYMLKLLQANRHHYQVLHRSLELELNNLCDTLLYAFALVYDRNQIKDVRAAFWSGKREAIANALEIIEMTVRKDIAGCFNAIFEPAEVEEKVYALQKFYPVRFFRNVEVVLRSILAEEEGYHYDNWTAACSLYTSKKGHHALDNNVISKYLVAEHPLVSEAARFASLTPEH